jgi:anaerobic selenocysteine-containing dehydrogenase
MSHQAQIEKTKTGTMSRRSFLFMLARGALLGGVAIIGARALRLKKTKANVDTIGENCNTRCGTCTAQPLCSRREAALFRMKKRNGRK